MEHGQCLRVAVRKRSGIAEEPGGGDVSWDYSSPIQAPICLCVFWVGRCPVWNCYEDSTSLCSKLSCVEPKNKYVYEYLEDNEWRDFWVCVCASGLGVFCIVLYYITCARFLELLLLLLLWIQSQVVS